MIKRMKRNAKRNNSFMWSNHRIVRFLWNVELEECTPRIRTYPKRKRSKR